MSRIVLDANTALDWFIVSDEGNVYSQPLAKRASQAEVRFAVPVHFDIEVTRILYRTHHKNPQDFPAAWLNAALQTLDVLPIDIMVQGVNFQLLGQLATAYNLAVPDVPYFHLARMMELPIATRDRGIISACKRWNVLHWKP